jgi:hypothetical protein
VRETEREGERAREREKKEKSCTYLMKSAKLIHKLKFEKKK